MNERIKQLWEEASKTTPVLPYSWDDATSFIERFAHMVVHDTIKEVCQQMNWAGDDQSNNPAMYKAIEKTLNEFGVK